MLRRSITVGILFLCLIIMTEGAAAQAFPFRALKKGDPLPPVTVESLDGKTLSLNTLNKGVAVILFWGADSAIKRRHAITAMRDVPRNLAGLGDNVTFVSVNVLGDSPETITSVAEKAEFEGALYRDAAKRVYKAFGLFVLPSILVVKNGKVVAGFGYTHNLGEITKGEVEVLLGLKTRAAVEAGLHPKSHEKSEAEKEALRYGNLGMSMLRKGMLPQAEEAFKKALKKEETYLPALLGLAEISLRQKNLEGAKRYLRKAKSIASEALDVVLLEAKILAAGGRLDEALKQVLPLSLTNPGSEKVNAVLGELYERKGEMQKALKYFKKALKACQQRK